MSASRQWRGFAIAAVAVAAWAAIGAGAFQQFYVRIYREDRALFKAQFRELPYRRVPGLRSMLMEVDRRTPDGSRIVINLPHRPWQGRHEYGFRRDQYLLQRKVVLPLLYARTSRIDWRNVRSADWLLRSFLYDDMPKLARAVATLILMPLVFSPFIGMAEGPLIAYALVGVLRIRRGILHSGRADVLAGAVFLGLAASCKNEGLSLIAAVAVAMLSARAWRSLPMLWPALAIPIPWLVMQRMHRVHGNLEQKGSMDRLLLRLSDVPSIAARMLERTGVPLLFWIGIAVAIVVVGRRLVGQERFLLVATVMQLLFYAAVHLVTPYQVRWHIDRSWDRILRQILPFIALLAMLPTAPVIASALRRNNATDSRTDRPTRSTGTA